jgi:hypothetical protein
MEHTISNTLMFLQNERKGPQLKTKVKQETLKFLAEYQNNSNRKKVSRFTFSGSSMNILVILIEIDLRITLETVSFHLIILCNIQEIFS